MNAILSTFLRMAGACVIALLGGALSEKAQAKCDAFPGFSGVTMNASWPEPVRVPRDAGVGAVIAKKEFPAFIREFTDLFLCEVNIPAFHRWNLKGSLVGETIVESGVSGIGFRFVRTFPSGRQEEVWNNQIRNVPAREGTEIVPNTESFNIRVEIIKLLDKVGSGRTKSDEYLDWTADSGFKAFSGKLDSIYIQAGGCNIDTYHANMRIHRGSDFREIGSTVGHATWGYRLDCTAGVSKVTLAFKAPTGFVSGGDDGLINLEGGSARLEAWRSSYGRRRRPQ